MHVYSVQLCLYRVCYNHVFRCFTGTQSLTLKHPTVAGKSTFYLKETLSNLELICAPCCKTVTLRTSVKDLYLLAESRCCCECAHNNTTPTEHRVELLHSDLYESSESQKHWPPLADGGHMWETGHCCLESAEDRPSLPSSNSVYAHTLAVLSFMQMTRLRRM